MDLQSFATLSKEKNSLLPKQQKTRAYKSVETEKPNIQLQMTKSRVGKQRGKFILRFIPQLPYGIDRKEITNKQVEEFAKEYAIINTDRGEEKYINVEKANLAWIEYSFDIDKWFNDNFRGKSPKYKPPITLKFSYRQDLPRFIYVNSSFYDLRKFIIDKFRDWLKKNNRMIKHRKFSFLDKITPDIFEFKLDVQSMNINASLRYSVILGSLAAYMLFFHNKDIKGSEKEIRRKVQRYSDIKKLDRYVMKL
jgi:hypothetical protein